MRIWLDDKRPMEVGYDLHVKTAIEAIRAIRKNRHSLKAVALDHDLGEKKETGNGYDVAKYLERLAQRGELGRIEWRILSDNGPGRKNIEAAMKSAERFWGED